MSWPFPFPWRLWLPRDWPAWHTIYSEWDGCLVRGHDLRRRAHGVLGRAGLPGDGLGEGKSRKNFVEIAAEMCQQGHPARRWLAGQARGKLSRAPTSWTGGGCRNDRMPAPAYRHRLRSRIQPRAAGSADTADARKPGRTIPYCCGRPRIGVRCRHWLPARTSPRRAPRNGDRRIFPPFRFSIPGPCCVSVRSEARLQPLCIMYISPTKKARGPGPRRGGRTFIAGRSRRAARSQPEREGTRAGTPRALTACRQPGNHI